MCPRKLDIPIDPHPLKITINSMMDMVIQNFDVLGSIQCTNNESITTDDGLVVYSVIVRSGNADITYREMLCQFKSSMYSVGITYVQSTTPGQSEEPIYLCRGGIYELLIPTIDPFLDSPEIVALKRPYCIDGSTKIILSKLYPHSSVRLYFYPLETVNLARGLCGRLLRKRFNSSIFLTGK
jgi:hypothetical protein